MSIEGRNFDPEDDPMTVLLVVAFLGILFCLGWSLLAAIFGS